MRGQDLTACCALLARCVLSSPFDHIIAGTGPDLPFPATPLVAGTGLDRVLRFACTLRPCLPLRSPSDRALLESPPDFLADGHAFTGSSPSLSRVSPADAIKKADALLHLLNLLGCGDRT